MSSNLLAMYLDLPKRVNVLSDQVFLFHESSFHVSKLVPTGQGCKYMSRLFLHSWQQDGDILGACREHAGLCLLI